MTDEEILTLYWNREETAISATNEKFGPYCHRIAWNILVNEEDSQECLNDTWLKTWSSIPPQKPTIFSAFLGKITRNLAIDRVRKETADKRGNGAIHTVYEELEECIQGGVTPEQELEGKELAAKISAFLWKCKKVDRDIFIRRYWYMDSLQKIEMIYGFSTSKVKSILHRMRRHLKEELKKEGYVL